MSRARGLGTVATVLLFASAVSACGRSGTRPGYRLFPDAAASPDGAASIPDAGVAAPVRSGPRAVIVVWQGLRPDAINLSDTPNLFAFREMGVEFLDHHSIFPTTTMVNAASLVTGSFPSQTGVFGGTVYAPAVEGTSASGLPVGGRSPIATDDFGTLTALSGAYGRWLLRPSLFEVAQAKGIETVALGKAGAATLFDLGRKGLYADDDMLWPRKMVDTMLARRLPVPANTALAYPGVTFDYTSSQLAPTRPLAVGFENQTAHPLEDMVSPFAGVDLYFARQVAQGYVMIETHPDLWVLWMRDPDATAQIYGLNTPPYQDALRSADAAFGQLLVALNQTSGTAPNVLVVSDHGESNVSGPLSTFALRRLPLRTDNNGSLQGRFAVSGSQDPQGFSVSGGVRLGDLLFRGGIEAYDGATCVYSVALSGVTSEGHFVYPQELSKGSPLCTAEYTTVLDPIPPRLSAGSVVIASNGGVELLYIPSGDADVAKTVVRLLQQREETGPIFVAKRFGAIPGTISMSALQLELDAPEDSRPRPDIVVSYDWDDTAAIQGAPGISFASMLNRRGSSGSFSPRDVHATLIASGPAFRKGYKSRLPTSSVDIAPTVARLMGFDLPGAQGRPLLEALAQDGASDTDYALSFNVLAAPQPATGLEMHRPTSPLPNPGPEDIDSSATSFTTEVRVKTVVKDGRSFVYFDSGRAIRH